MYSSAALHAALIRDRVGELQHNADPANSDRDPAHVRRVIEAARCGAGWLLVDLGLRLATRSGSVGDPTA